MQYIRPEKIYVFQVTWNFKKGTGGRVFCSEFLNGNNRESVCQNGKTPQNPLKILKKKLGSVVKN